MESSWTKLDGEIVNILQKQVQHELENHNFYLSIAMWCNDLQFVGAEKFYRKQADEEKEHMKIFSDYLLDKKIKVTCPEIKKIEINASILFEVLMLSLNREKFTTDAINKIADLAVSKKDHQTYELALKMLKEQVQEEASFLNLLDRWKILEKCGNGEFFLDKEMGS